MLTNPENVAILNAAKDQTISSLTLDAETGLTFEFENGYKMRLNDEGQDCCEHRYMTTDDDLSYFVGSKFIGAVVRDMPNVVSDDNEDVAHELAFLLVSTNLGVFTCETHNEHNGYYGGISIIGIVEETEKA